MAQETTTTEPEVTTSTTAPEATTSTTAPEATTSTTAPEATTSTTAPDTTTSTTVPDLDDAGCSWEWGGVVEASPSPCDPDVEYLSGVEFALVLIVFLLAAVMVLLWRR